MSDSALRASPELFARPASARSEVGVQSLSASRLAAAKRAFTTRRVDLTRAVKLATTASPAAGDLVLARITSLGLHARLESPFGRRCKLYLDDEIVVAYGARYAPDQFEAIVPNDLGACDLIAGGGVAGEVLSRHAKVAKPTRIAPVGLLADRHGAPINLRDFALSPRIGVEGRPLVVAVAGSSMNAGKTTSATALVHGLSRAGLRVGAAKVTGTGSGGDIWSMVDAGAHEVFDFTDMGHATTAGLDPTQVETVALGLIDQLTALSSEVIVLEIADGVLQRETAALLQSERMRSRLDGVVFAAADALGAIGGVDWLRRLGYPMLCVTGVLSSSPLASREATTSGRFEVLGPDELMDPATASKLCFRDPAHDAARVSWDL